MRMLAKALLWTSAALAVGTGLIGFAHTEAGRPLLGWLMATTGCPVSLDGADPAATERYRVNQLQRRVGETAARSHPALDFELGVTHRAEVDRWLAAHHVACESARDNSVLRCARAVAFTAAGGPAHAGDELAASDLHLQFDARERLVAVDLFRETASERAAVAHLRQTERNLNDAVGPVTHHHGDAAEGYLQAQRMRRVTRGYHYRNYVATLSATWLGDRARLREQYQWLPPTAGSPEHSGS